MGTESSSWWRLTCDPAVLMMSLCTRCDDVWLVTSVCVCVTCDPFTLAHIMSSVPDPIQPVSQYGMWTCILSQLLERVFEGENLHWHSD